VYNTLHTTIVANNITSSLTSFFWDEVRDQHIQFHPLTKLYTYCHQHLQLKNLFCCVRHITHNNNCKHHTITNYKHHFFWMKYVINIYNFILWLNYIHIVINICNSKTPLVAYNTLHTTIIANITPSLTSFIFGWSMWSTHTISFFD